MLNKHLQNEWKQQNKRQKQTINSWKIKTRSEPINYKGPRINTDYGNSKFYKRNCNSNSEVGSILYTRLHMKCCLKSKKREDNKNGKQNNTRIESMNWLCIYLKVQA